MKKENTLQIKSVMTSIVTININKRIEITKKFLTKKGMVNITQEEMAEIGVIQEKRKIPKIIIVGVIIKKIVITIREEVDQEIVLVTIKIKTYTLKMIEKDQIQKGLQANLHFYLSEQLFVDEKIILL